MNDFYVTLPSNTNFEDNTIGSFRVQLPKRIQLEGNWAVGLTEIVYPHSWNNIIDEWVSFKRYNIDDDTTEIKRVKITPGYYDNIQDLIKAINTCLANQYLHGKNKFEWDKTINRVKATNDPTWYMVLSVGLNYMLGSVHSINNTDQIATYPPVKKANFKDKGITKSNKKQYLKKRRPKDLKPIDTLLKIVTNQIATYPPDLSRGMTMMYVYSDIVMKQIVGDTMAPLLRTVKLEGDAGDTVEKIFQAPHYIPLLKRDFDHIKVYIRSDTGEPMPFLYGKILVKLHFKRNG